MLLTALIGRINPLPCQAHSKKCRCLLPIGKSVLGRIAHFPHRPILVFFKAKASAAGSKRFLAKNGERQETKRKETRGAHSDGQYKNNMLDQYEQHTLKCSSCRKAFEKFQLAQKVLWGATVVFAAGAGVPPDMSFHFNLAAEMNLRRACQVIRSVFFHD